MKTHVVILAQGTQQRMGDAITIPKQLLPLPACGGIPILHRTLLQLARIEYQNLRDPAGRVTVVAWSEVLDSIFKHRMLTRSERPPAEGLSLLEPGNSSLKGIHRYLALTAGAEQPERTIVLLGDVVYSWRCLQAIFEPLDGPYLDSTGIPRCRFVGTPDISPSGGELWGIAWERVSDTKPTGRRGMIDALESALEKHPPFQAYQPGQLRRWMWQIHPSFHTTIAYKRVDDYTMDVDLAEHIGKLGPASELAKADDREHGLIW